VIEQSRQAIAGLNAGAPVHADAPAAAGRPLPESIDLGVLLDRDGAAAGRPALPAALRLPLAVLSGSVLVAGSAGAGKSQTVRRILEQAGRHRLPWLVIDPAGSGYDAIAAGQVTVINPCDPHAVPLTVSPLAPEPGYPVQAHIAMVRSLLDVAFDADEPFSLIMSQALQRVYQAAGWDLVTGGAPRAGGAAPPVTPALWQLHAAVIEAIGQAGYGRKMRARLRGAADARFGALRAGSAGRFLEGGHPADIGELLGRDVVLAIHDVGGDEDRALIAGTLMIRVAEHLRLRARGQRAGVPPDASRAAQAGPRHVMVIEQAGGLLRDRGKGRPASRAAVRFAGLLAESGAYGEGMVITEQSPATLVPDAVKNAAVRIVHRLPARDDQEAAAGMLTAASGPDAAMASLEPGVAVVLAGGADRPRWVRVPARAPAGHAAGVMGGRLAASAAAARGRGGPGNGTCPGDAPAPVSGRRSAACGRQCREVRACHLSELRGAELLAESAEDAWLRVWTETFLLAFLTDRPLPAAAAPVCRRWHSLGTQTRECLLARVVDRCVGVRAAALRESYDPARLTGIVALAAGIRLDGTAGRLGAGPPLAARPGPAWVIPQLRWLHEMERVCPLGGPGLAAADLAPPLDFDLVRLPDWPGMQAGQRVRALRRHPLSMELAPNRRLAWTALVGEDGPAAFAADLAQIAVGADPVQQLRHAARLMDVSGSGAGAGPGWLEVVLSWPRRFIAACGDGRARTDAADCVPA
jgi:uncharacterized protein